MVPNSALSPQVRMTNLVGVEQPWLTLPQPRQPRFLPLFAIPHQLLERLEHGVGGEVVGILALDDHQGNAVHEQHDVGDDEVLDPARRVDTELVDCQEMVPLGVVEVDQLDIGVLLAGQFVDIDLGAVEEFLDGFVGFDAGCGWAGRAVRRRVPPVACRSASSRPSSVVLIFRTLSKNTPLRMISRKLVRRLFVGSVGNARSLVNDIPVQRAKLVQERLFDEEVFGHGYCPSDSSTLTRTLPVRRSCMRPVLSVWSFARNRRSLLSRLSCNTKTSPIRLCSGG